MLALLLAAIGQAASGPSLTPPVNPSRAAAQSAAAAPTTRGTAAPMTPQDLSAFFDGIIPYAIHRDGVAGSVIVVVRGDRVLFAKGYGYADLAKRTPVVADRTMFRPGSVSKLFTWTAVMQQVQAGKIDLDADVNNYLDFKIPPKFGKPITMRTLMTHSAGFEETILDLMVDKPEALYPIRDYLIKRMPDRIYPPGTVVAYSNYGATLAGYIVQRVSGEPFDDYIAKHIFSPLRMTRATFVQPLPKQFEPFMSKGYQTTASDTPTPYELVEPAPAGALAATGTDMGRFMLAYLNDGSYQGGNVLKPATIKQMWTLQLRPAPNILGFDLGFYQENRNGLEIVGHGGDTNVFHSDLHLLPAQHVGFFMSVNSLGLPGSSEAVRQQIFRGFLNRYYPYDAPQPPTLSTAKSDSARAAGWYISSRRAERALRFVYALGQSGITANDDGTIQASGIVDPAGHPLKWREIKPFFYQEDNGQTHLGFALASDGTPVSWAVDDINVFDFQRVNGLTALGTLKLMLTCFIAILILSLLIRLSGWIARRVLKLRLELPPRAGWVHLAARIGAIAFLVVLAGWVVTLSNDELLLSPSLVPIMIVLYVIGLIALLGGIAMIAETLIRVRSGPGGWLVRGGEIVVALAAVYGIWFLLTFGLASFVTNF
jgi:CubicO group peptidase (beta-lactamase class C family)